jgi:hypothetical protein
MKIDKIAHDVEDLKPSAHTVSITHVNPQGKDPSL